MRTGFDITLDASGSGTTRQANYGILVSNPGRARAGQCNALLALTYNFSYASVAPLCGGGHVASAPVSASRQTPVIASRRQTG